MTVQDNERRLDRLDASMVRKDVCETVRTRLEGRIRDVEKHVDGMRQRATATLIAVIFILLGVAINLILVVSNMPHD